MIEWIFESVGELPLVWLLFLAFALPFGETVALLDLFVPGEVGLIVLGAAADESGRPVVLVILAGAAGAFVGDSTSWYIGHRWGTAIVDRWQPVAKRLRPMLERAERYFERRGGPAILGCRFVGPLRSMVPLIAGAAGMTYRRFAPWNLAGAVLWVTTIVSLGALFGRPFERLVERYGIIVTVVFVVVIVLALAWYGTRRSRRAHGRIEPSETTRVAE